MITPLDLSFLRGVVNSFLVDKATIIGRTGVPDGMGGETDTDQVIASDVPCAVFPGAGSEVNVINTVSDVKTVTIVFRSDVVSLKPTYRVIINSITYEIQDVTTYGYYQAYVAVSAVMVVPA